MDLNGVSYCTGAYGGPSYTRVAENTGCDVKECRFHFFVAVDISAGEEIIYNCGDLTMSSVWAKFGLYITKIYHGGKVQCTCDIINNIPQE